MFVTIITQFVSSNSQKKQCTVVIVDDEDFEQDEVLHLKLGLPLGSNGITAMLGQNAMATVTITNYDDGLHQFYKAIKIRC